MSSPPTFGHLAPATSLGQGVSVLSTLRHGGFSCGPYGAASGGQGGFNLALHCGDAPEAVGANRALLQQVLPGPVHWLHQVHGNRVAVVDPDTTADPAIADAVPGADAAVTRHPGQVLAVLSADCLPVVIADRQGRAIGVAHAGWRGLAAGVLENTLAAVLDISGGAPGDCSAWLGPAIGPLHFEVGPDVLHAFCAEDPGAVASFRRSASSDKWYADLPALARRRLVAAGVARPEGGTWCTFADSERFFSYRRDRVTGRMATLAWIA